jgi:hypothetical protein
MWYHWRGGHGAPSQDFLCHASAILDHLGLLPLSSYVWTELVWKLSEHLDSWNWWPVLSVNQQMLDILVLRLRLFEFIIVSLISCNDAFRWCLYVIWCFLCRIFLKFAGWTFCLKAIAALHCLEYWNQYFKMGCLLHPHAQLVEKFNYPQWSLWWE